MKDLLRHSAVLDGGDPLIIRVKICGITNEEDAMRAVDLGVNALGFIFASSPRQVNPEAARRIIEALPPYVQTVGVFVDETLSRIRDLIDLCGLDLVQLQGGEDPDFCRELMPQAVKSFRLKDESSLQPISRYGGLIRAVHLDTYQKGLKGGTGAVFDWTLAVEAKKLGMPVILSGGLDPSNIERAISSIRPFAVDVNSGIEKSPGIKDPVLMKDLMEKIRRMEIE
jgi:phosphoribosylanthranilate isomerase